MGIGNSKHMSSGTLLGAYAPPLPSVVLPPKLNGRKKFQVRVPEGKRGGECMTVEIQGRKVDIKIPKRDNPPLRPGDKFAYEHPAEISRVIASTLPSLPGVEIVESKPIIWSTVTHAYYRNNYNDQREQSSMGKAVGGLLQECQAQLLEKTIEVGCNVVLGITSSVTTDSSGEHGNSKVVIVTMTGTPCNVVPASHLPPVMAEAMVIPLTNY